MALLVLALTSGSARTAASATCPCSIFAASATPAQPAVTDGLAIEVGVKFRADSDGYITALRFYKGAANTGTHTGHLWSASGTQLAAATFTNETASGWQQVQLAQPVQVAANTTYVASYWSSSGYFAYTNNAFAANVDNAPLHALSSSSSGGNGVYRYGTSAFPNASYQASNYWVDVVFATGVTVDTTPPAITSVAPADGATGVDPAARVTVQASEPLDPASVTASTVKLSDAGGAAVAATLAYTAGATTLTLTPSSPLAYSSTYTATVKGGAGGVTDVAGNPLAQDKTWTFTTAAAPTPSCPCSIFAGSATPAQAAVSDGQAIEVGVKFRTDVAGYVTALRFYKGTANTGTHTGHLWSAGGTQLAAATFSNETSSGWQQVQLAQPVQVAANTTYVASYWSSSGYFAYTSNTFAASIDNVPLHALSSSGSGGNGVYRYGTSGFPNASYQASNYWVDVVFATTATDTTAPLVTSVSPADTATGVGVNAQVTAQFNEALNPGTVSTSTFTLRSSGGAVAATVSYAGGTATLAPSAPLAYSTAYTATLKGGAGGITDAAGNPLAQDKTWTFTTAAPPPAQGSGGPILVLTSSSDNFGGYLAEILRTEGLNEFAVGDVSTLSASTLAGYQVVLLGHMALTIDQVSTLTSWVNAGGKLIAMRPDAKLAGLLGLTIGSGSLGDAYLRIDTSQSPGAGITSTTMQFHGSADRYFAASGTRTVATLYSTASSPTSSPAVTLRNVGVSGGQAAAFTYDLARSVVYTHQGNPAWAGQERDGALDQGSTTIRSDDLFYGGSVADYIDLNKVQIPQADEQQRLLANLITSMEASRLPIPRFWYFPNGYKAAVVLTGDAHGNGSPQTNFAFDRFIAQSPANCSVVDWTCVRATAYIGSDTVDLSDADAASYEDQGFEVAMHLHIPGPNECDNFGSYQALKDALDSQLDGEGFIAGFLWRYRDVQPPATIRTHCIVWSDWDSQVRADLSRGIRLNTDYYYWPAAWVAGRPGVFTGEGIPMRFAAQDGSTYDVYQAATQLPDETFSTPTDMSAALSTLLGNALGSNGYYGFFTTNVHEDDATVAGRAVADAVVAAAQARGVPLISARQLLTWLDGRNTSSFQNLSYASGHLRFTVAVGTGAHGLQAMLPARGPAATISAVTRNGQAVAFTRQTIKGVDYAVIPAAAGDYDVTYG